MIPYVGRRLAQAVLVLWAAYTVTFGLLYLLPSDAAEIMAAGGDAEATVDPAALERFRARFGLDRPLWLQYVSALGGALTGDFGVSVRSGRPVVDIIAEAFPPTLALTLAGLVAGALLGLLLSLAATLLPDGRLQALQRFLTSLPALGIAIPTFGVGLVLLQIVSFRWGLLPAFGDAGPRGLILPVLALSLPIAAVIAQLLISGIHTQSSQEYVTTARAKGVGRLRLRLAHVLPNALLPALTMTAVLTGELLGGSIIVETVFSRPGLGRIVVSAVTAQDLPLVLGLVTTGAIVFVLVNLLVDVVHPLLDPRVGWRRA
ncbi:peptide/nickel transport system permease protein [Pseudonocardia thermophila]|jgi:ABC-type dipeptide/oligopeptide/nickel transport systems, permease components|uniref:Peptide/nickel transport system permease protein n=1 Tax=Pseudonocardia thermophila TaxID=1848 RepID=A0A1M6Q3T7_PSETH|nr:ABC transporter permease [Pseudonocardia thermophila]SHK14777.1 peptide/nickel transport system permease protein [Pseudonocardia thermophila]